MGLAEMLAALIESRDGRRAVDHLHQAAHAEEKPARRHHLRAAVRIARRVLLDGASTRLLASEEVKKVFLGL